MHNYAQFIRHIYSICSNVHIHTYAGKIFHKIVLTLIISIIFHSITFLQNDEYK